MADQTDGPIALPVTLPLAGREREQAALRQALDDAARAERGGLVLIGGEAGIGKTALAETLLAEAAARGAQLLVGRCYDLGETPPYGPWTEALTRAPGDSALPTLPLAVLPALPGGEVLTSQEAIIARTAAYLAALASRRPLVLLLEDLHWSDRASLDLLRVVGRGLAAMSLLLIVTYRADEVNRDHPLATLLPALVREARVTRLDLRPLDAAALADLVATRYALAGPDRDRLVSYLAARTEGNALFVVELLRTLEAEGALRPDENRWILGGLAAVPVPALLHQVIDARLRRLPPAAVQALGVAAVIGQEVPLALWAAVTQTDEGALLDHVERALAARLVIETPDARGIRFVHALIREALYVGLEVQRRHGWHRRVAEAQVAQPVPDPDAIANHFQRAGDPRAFAWLVRAGLRARRAGAQLTAGERFATAALLTGNQGSARVRAVLLLLSAAARLLSDARQALRDLDAAAALADAAGDRALAAYIGFRRGQARCTTGAIHLGLVEMGREAAALDALPRRAHLPLADEALLATITAVLPEGSPAPSAPDPEAGSAAPTTGYRSNLANWLAIAGRYREALAHGEAIVGRPGVADRGVRADLVAPARRALGHAYAALGRPAEARREYALERAARHPTGGLPNLEYSYWFELLLVGLPYHADAPDERRRVVAEARHIWSRARGTETAATHGTPTDLLAALPEGRWADARRLAREGCAAGTVSHAQGATLALGTLARYQGDPPAAWACVHALHAVGPATAPGDGHFPHGLAALALAAELALDAGDLAAAERWIAAHGRWLAWSDAVLWRADHLLLVARHARASGDLDAARHHARAALARAAEPRQPLALLAAHRLLGELATIDLQSAEATTHLDAALALAAACAVPYERALTLLALAELGVATGDHPAATAALDAARALLEPLAALPALARAAGIGLSLAAPSGSADRRAADAPAPPGGLSRHEAEVLSLLAAGRSNHQIAHTLCLSPRTVQRHIANAYLKIGAHNKADATVFAVDHGLR